MEAESGEQADHTPGYRRAGEGEPVVLRERACGSPIETATHPFELANRDEPRECLPVDPVLREFQRAIEIGRGSHVAKRRHLRASVNTSPHRPARLLSPNCPRTLVGHRLLSSAPVA